ncbi:MAG: insulinase family protein [Sphingobacteriaceae bacterium]|nr:insulinase family protein [Sphingobacteriaceae bacterium]
MILFVELVLLKITTPVYMIVISFKKLHVCLLLFFLPFVSFSQPNSAIPLDPDVVQGTLPNGFTYYLRKNKVPENRAFCYLACKAGSVLETDQQQGLAHFIEHMGFNGTSHFPKNELISYLQKAGVRFGADLNAYTSYNETVYKLPVPTDDKALFDNALQIIRDWAQDITFDPTEIDNERGVVLEEMRIRRTAGQRIREGYYPLIYSGSQYLKRSPIGIESVLKNASQTDFKQFYTDWYRPNLQALIIVGDIDLNKVERKIKALFGELKNPANEKPRIKYDVKLSGKNQFIAVKDKEYTSTSAQILIKHKALPLKTEANFANHIARTLINQMVVERFRALNKASERSFISASAGLGFASGDLDLFNLVVSSKPEELENAIKSVWREVQRIKKFGFSADELQLQKRKLGSSAAYSLQEKDKTNSLVFVNVYLQHFLNNRAAGGPQVELDLIKKYMGPISLGSINTFCNDYISDFNRDIILMAPESAALPDEQTVNSWLTAVDEEDLDNTVVASVSRSIMPKKPSPGKIISETKNKSLKLTEITLQNGIKVILKPTDFRTNQILFTSFASGGTSVADDKNLAAARFSPTLIQSSGVGDFSAADLNSFLVQYPVTVTPYISEKSQGISGNTSASRLEKALQLVHLYFVAPRRDSAEYLSQIQKSKNSLSSRSNNPLTVFSDSVNAFLSGNSIRRRAFSTLEIDNIKLDDAFGFYKERFSDASAFTFIFTGDFDANIAKPLLEQYLGSLPSTTKNIKAKGLNLKSPEGKHEKVYYKGIENKANVELAMFSKFEVKPEESMVFKALEDVIKSKLHQRLREVDGGTYTVSARLSAGKTGSNLNVRFTCSPENVNKLVNSAWDEFENIKRNGPSDAELQKFKAEYITMMETQVKNNDFWLSYLTEKYQKEEDLNEVLIYKEKLGKITTRDIQDAALKSLDGKNYVKFVIHPESLKK